MGLLCRENSRMVEAGDGTVGELQQWKSPLPSPLPQKIPPTIIAAAVTAMIKKQHRQLLEKQ